MDAVTKSLAKELGPRKIRVNSVNPGVTETEGVHEMAGFLGGSEANQLLAKTPLGRIGQPIDIAPAVAFWLPTKRHGSRAKRLKCPAA